MLNSTRYLDFIRGIYRKFKVERTDGSSEPGGKHQHCQHFVIDLNHDPFAAAALEAYAKACAEDYPTLAADIQELLTSNLRNLRTLPVREG
jgi:hypothetical protein